MFKHIFLLIFCASITAKAADTVTILTGTDIIDARRDGLIMGQTIIIQGEKILAVTDSSSLDISAYPSATIKDMSGTYIMPGLVDSHVHLATMANAKWAEAMLERYIFSGITTVRDMAGDARLLADLKRRLMIGKIAGPNLYFSALMAGPSFYNDPRPKASAAGETPGEIAWMQAITDKTDMKIAVARAKGTYASGIKIYANLKAEYVTAIVSEARRQNFPVWAHSMVFPALPSQVISTGLNSISHVCRLAFEISAVKPKEYHHKIQLDYSKLPIDHPRYNQIFATMKKNGTVLDATVRLYREIEAYSAAHADTYTKPICPAEYAYRLTGAAMDAGVLISAGTDGTVAPTDDYPALWQEIEILQDRVGMTPHQAITAATLNGAKILGLDTVQGTIEAGKDADFIVLKENPLDTVANIKSLIATYKSGVEYAREGFTPSPALASERN